MAGPWEEFAPQQSDNNGPWSEFAPSEKPKKQNKGLVADIGTDLKRGVQNIPSAITGLADIPVAAVTGSPLISAAAEGLGKMTGFQPGQWAKEAEQEYSEGRKQARQNIDAAWKDGTAGDIASAYLQNPSQIAGSIAESLPSMLVGGLAGRGLTAASKLISPVIGSGLGEGAVMAGQAMDNLTEQGVDPRTAAGYAAGTGIVGAALGAGGGKVAQMLGVVDPETAIAGGAARAIREGATATKWQAAKETGKNIIGGGISEGIFEELPQSVMEQGLSNLAQGKPIGEGVARAGVEGALAGFGMGAGFNAIPARQEPQGPLGRTVEAGKQSGAIQEQPLALGYNANVRTDGAPLYTYPDGSTLTQAEYEQRQAAEEKQRLDGMIQDAPLTRMAERAQERAAETAPDRDLANLIAEEKNRLDPVRAGLASVALERQQARQEKQSARSQKGDGSFSNMNEFADLLNSERQQVESSRRAIAAKQALRRESDLESADARVADSMAKESEQKRRNVLESVLSDPAVKNHAAKFSAELKRQGFRNVAPTESELSSISRFGDILNAQPETTIEPSLPNEATAEQMGIKERKEAAQAQGTQRDKIAEVQQLVSAGWKVNGRTLVSPTGKKRNLNFAERYAAVKAQQENRGDATQAQPLAQEAPQANDAQAGTQSAAAQEAEGVANAQGSQGRINAESKTLDGSTVYDSNGNPYRVHYQRNHLVVAHPIVDGKAQVNADSTVRFWVTPDRSPSSDNDRTDPIYSESPVDKTPAKMVNESRGPAPIAKRDDLVGAIMRVTGGKGIANSMKLDVTGDTKGNNRTLSGLFTDNGTADLGEIANLLSLEEGYSVRDGNHLAELVRDAAAGNMTYSMARTEREAAENAEKEYKASVNQKAEELGLKKVGGKRTLAMVEADIAAKEKEISEQEAREERASIQASEIAEDIYQEGSELTEADLMQWLGDRIEYSQDEINEANSRASERESRRVEKNAGDDSQEQAQGSSPEGSGTGATEAGARSTESLNEPTDDLISRAKALGMKTVGVSAEKLTKQVEEAESFNLSKQTNEQAAAEYKRQQEEANKKDEEPAAPDVKADQVDMWNTQGSLIDNNRDSEQNPSNSETTPSLNAADSVISQAESIEDFGEKLEGARKDRTPSLSKELSDDDISTQPLSKIWPAAEIDAIENTFAAAVAFAARNEIPAKPRKSYLVARWVEKVKMLRSLASKIVNIGEDKAREIWSKAISSSDFKAKVALLESIDRDQWERIGTVSEYPNAYRYGENGEQIKSPIVRVEVDGKGHNFDDATSVADVIEKVNGLLGVEKQAKKMQFEVRGRGDRYFINKKGDKEYRKLKEFTNTKDAFAFIKDNYDGLVAAWDGVKDRDNVTKLDVRNAENRPRTGSDWRNGKDVTAEKFQDAFGFRGGQFGKWVTQGNSAKERQWMLNQAYDALMDLASIVGIPPKAISLNGSLGLAFGARGSGNAAAHFEPDTLVINLTKTKGAGSLAHEWFHALDNYFSRQRGGEVKIKAGLNAQQAYRTQNFITYRPEPMYVHKSGRTAPMTKARLEQNRRENPKSSFFAAENWQIDPNHPAGVRPEVERSFAELVEALDASPMKSRAAMNDKATDGYWSRIIERGARAFENFVIFKMMENGYNNDYLANVRNVQDFPRAKERYPYLLPEEVAPIAAAFDNLFATIQTKETDNGIAMYSFAGQNAATADTYALAAAQQRLAAGEDAETVRKETGWFRGAEGKWKYEISDADARLKADGETFEDVFNAIKQDRALTVSDVIDHPALFAAYPAIGNLRIRFIPFSEQGRGNIAVYIQNGNPMFGGNRIEVERTTDSATALSAILHEIQHGIQTIEGFASGGNMRSFAKDLPDGSHDNGYGSYRRLAGEVEARNTQSRQNMTDAERRATPPSQTADVADSDVIVVFNGKEMASAPAPANAQPMQQPMQQSQAEQRIKSLLGNKVARILIESGIVSFVNRGNAYQGATFENGNIVLNLDALSADNFDGVLLHEGFHSTIKQLVGDETYAKLMKQLESMLKMGRGAQWVKDANAAVPDDTKPENVTEEIAAYAVEQVINGGKLPNVLQRWVDNFLSAIRTAIIQHMPSGKLKNWAVMNLKAQDLANLALAGLKAKAAGQVQAQGREAMAFSTAFGKESQHRTPIGDATEIEVDGIKRSTMNSNGMPIHWSREGVENFWRWFSDSKVVDAEGQPLVVYHGTAKDFTRFDLSKSGESTGNTGFYGAGAYFSEDGEDAGGYALWARKDEDDAANVIPAYLSLKDPLYLHINPKDDARKDKARASLGRIVDQLLSEGYFGNNPDKNEAGSLYSRLTTFVEKADFERFMGTLYNELKGGEGVSNLARRAGFDGVMAEGFKRGENFLAEAVAFDPTQIKSATGNTGDFGSTNPDIRYSKASQAIRSAVGAVTGAMSGTENTDGEFAFPSESKMDDIIYAMQDKQVDLKRVVEAIRKTGGKLTDEINPYLQEELFHGRSAKGVDDFLEMELKPLINEMRLRGVAMPDFEEYLWNRHAEERNNQIAKINKDMPDGGSGIKTAEARKYLSGLPANKKDAYESLAKRIDAINKKSQEILVSSGLEKQETIDAWNGAYQHYVPLHREDIDTGHIGTGKGYSIRGSASKRATGSNRAVVDVLANIAMQRERNIVRAEKNRMSNALFGLAVANPNSELWKVDEAPTEKAVVTRQGKDEVVTRVVPGFAMQDNVIHTRINGEDHYIIMNEREPRALRMAMAVKNLDANQLGSVLSATAKVTRFLAAINTQYNPIFGIINLVRDSQGSMLNLSTTPLHGQQGKILKYAAQALRGIYSDIRARRNGEVSHSEWADIYEEFQNAGGQTGYRDQFSNATERGEAIEKELKSLDRNFVLKRAGAVFDWLSDYNEVMENAVRVAVFRAAKEKGISVDRSASLAKNITVNFNRKGSVSTQMGALYAFFNAATQGTARLAETMTGPMGKKILYGGVLLGAMQAVLLASAGMGDDEPPEFVRERSLILPIGDGKYLTMPMPLGFHVLPNLGRIPMEFALSGFKNPADRIADLVGIFADTFNPIGNAGLSLQTIAPSIVDPFAALAENKDWTGKPIAKLDRDSLNPTPGYLRAKDTATSWSKGISYATNILTGGTDYKKGLFSPTPDQLDYLIGQLTGGVGREASKVEQTVMAPFTGEELPLYKVPLVGRFVGDTKGQAAEGGKFYSAIQRINEHENEIKGMASSGRGSEIAGYIAENPEANYVQYANRVERTIQNLKKAKRLAMEDGNDARVTEIESMITAQMSQFNESLKQVAN